MLAVKLLLICLFYTVLAKNEVYIGHKVYEVVTTNQRQQDEIRNLQSDFIDFWRTPSVRHEISGLVMVAPDQLDWFENKLIELGIPKKIHIDDVHRFLEGNEIKLGTLKDTGDKIFGFDAYYHYEEILQYLNGLPETYPERIEIVNAGETALNNDIVYIKSSTTDFNDENKPIVVIEGGINPREWITVSAAVNVIEKIQEETTLLENIDWIVIPLLNPDGYEYTRTVDRLWMKSRSINSHLGFICPGVNINRNFDIGWSGPGSSTSPCSHLYSGTEPFSEIESQVVKAILEKYGSRVKLYVSLQNNGPFVTYPWRYERAASGMFIQHRKLGLDMIHSMTRADYKLDVGWDLEDRASGTSSDYAQRNGVLYSLNVDIPQGENGVIIPEEDIEVMIQDSWEAIKIAAGNFI